MPTQLFTFFMRLLLICFVLMPFAAMGKKDTFVDSVSIYMKKNWSMKKKLTRSYTYVAHQSDEQSAYYIRSGHKLYNYAKQENDSIFIGRSLFLIGYGYSAKENFTLAIDYFFNCLKYSEPCKDTHILVNVYNNIGIAYSQQKQYEKAVVYLNKTLAIAEKKKDEKVIAICSNNLGIEFQNLKQFSLSEKYLKKSYSYFEQKKLYTYLPSILMNRGVTYFDQGMYDSALILYREAKRLNHIYNKDGDSYSIYNNLGELFYKLNDLDSSLHYLNLSASTIDTLNDRYSTRELYMHFAKTYSAKGNYNKAYYYLNKHTHVNSIIFNDENLKRSLTSESNFKMLQKENELKLLAEKNEFERKKSFLIYVLGSVIAFLLLIALVVMIYRFKEKKKANTLLALQKDQIQEQKREITDSINYAKRIQDSILPSSQNMQHVLGNYLLFYRPKDIVGGDFYYVEEMDNRKYFAVIDCTGHGVPGGFMSMLVYNAIQNVILDLKIQQPGKILDALAENLVNHFSQQGKKTIRDGMDMAMCCLYETNSKTILEFAGAQNPCWIVKKDTSSIVELNATKQPIGYFENTKPFVNHILELEKGDTIYLFSDGYADQFGGPNGKKFKYSNLKKLILEQNHNTIETIHSILVEQFDTWKNDFDQIDDVCVLAVRV